LRPLHTIQQPYVTSHQGQLGLPPSVGWKMSIGQWAVTVLCLTELWFYILLDTFQRRSWLGTEKLNLTQQKHTFINQKKCTTTQNEHKKLKPGLATSYDIRPGNGEGLFWFRCFTNLSLTYLLKTITHLLTAADPHGEGSAVQLGR